MKITVKQLKQLVRESLEESGYFSTGAAERGPMKFKSTGDLTRKSSVHDEPHAEDRGEEEFEPKGPSERELGPGDETSFVGRGMAGLEESLRKAVKAAVLESLKSTKR